MSTAGMGPTGPLESQEENSQLFWILARANQIASNTELDELLREMLELIAQVCDAETGTLYLVDQNVGELVFKVIYGDHESKHLIGQRIRLGEGIAGATASTFQTIVVEDLQKDPRWYGPVGESAKKLRNTIAFPLLSRGQVIGVVQVFNYRYAPLQLMQLLGNRMASEIEKSIWLQASQERSDRLETLVTTIQEITSTLDRDQILSHIVENAGRLLNAEASSLFLIDEDSGDLILYIARNVHHTRLPILRIPAGQGLIGHVVASGETVLLNDVAGDDRHYSGVDQISGLTTRSLIAVPLRSSKIVLGQERGASDSHIIGGLEAINKLGGVFTAEDAQLLEVFANQAATVLHIASLYNDANDLFFDSIKAVTAAIDAKDPYTRGHSQRVSDFSVAIARQLDLPPEMIHHIRIGGLLHDVGKIGVPDSILTKPEQLSEMEFEKMKAHPLIGANILGQVRTLATELHALAEHHERVDGAGYPHHLRGAQISLVGRIVAVADVFDALTSDRPYRQALEAEAAIQYLREQVGRHLDSLCVEALVQAYQRGLIQTQQELASR